MTGSEQNLISMRDAGMIDKETFDLMWKDLHAEDTAASNPVQSDEAQTAGPAENISNSINLAAGAYSAKGIREQNEDSFFLGTETGGAKDADGKSFSAQGDGPFFFAAADGMGGHGAGDAASAFVVTKLKQNASFQTTPVDDSRIEVILKAIHAELLADAVNRGTPKMGSTVAGIILQKENSGFFNAGDSRVYRLRHGYIQQISEDDSLSRFVPGAAKNIITNAVGAGQENINVASRFSSGFAVKGDIFLMCSDGVHGFITDEELALFLNQNDSPQEIAKLIVEKAIACNSDDNCTAVVVKYL